jgi:hypothetical protein
MYLSAVEKGGFSNGSLVEANDVVGGSSRMLYIVLGKLVVSTDDSM